MGDPSRRKKKYARPKKPWDKIRLEEERKIKKRFELKNKRELWKTEALVRKKRQSARKLLALTPEQREKTEKNLIGSLNRVGLLQQNALADDILGLDVPEVLERRLQTVVLRKGLANTLKQARQFIVHGHISVNNQKITTPSYLVKTNESIVYYGKPMVLKVPIKKELKKEFEESIPPKKEAEEKAEPTKEKGETEPEKSEIPLEKKEKVEKKPGKKETPKEEEKPAVGKQEKKSKETGKEE